MKLTSTVAKSILRFVSAAAMAVSLLLIGSLADGPSPAMAQLANPQLAQGATERDTNTRERPMAGITNSSDADLLRALKGAQGMVTIPDQKAARLIQPQGRDWRATVNGPVRVWGSWIILGMIALLIVFYLTRGTIRIDAGPSGRTIERFNAVERFVHWLTASSFVVLALTGLNITYGRYVLLPLLGPDVFSLLTIGGKYVHNYLAFPFMIGLVLMLVLWIWHNIPNRYDLQWLAAGGGLFAKGSHPPARKFNAGQKILFWLVIIGGAAISISGIYLLFPFQFGDVNTQQTAQLVHAVVSLILTAVIIAHIYIGSLGMEGAFDAMGTGMVDENWAREHHNVWVAEMKGERVPQAKPGHD
ncbi:MAG: formate dehydrogenase subunit gamma [Rhodospirillales bacterium]|nr:formate dehydrogenase subunit gamma [Rhodospirillales bacterium]